MAVKAVGAVVGAVAVVLLLFVVIAAGGVLGSTDTPTGGCAVVVPPDGSQRGVEQVDAAVNVDQMAVARTVVAVGKGLDITERGTAIALATAMQDSSLDPDAVNGRATGLFQQQGDDYAGIDKTNPAAAAVAFYRMLLDRIPNYDSPGIGFAEAAARVQASDADASGYAQWELWATALAGQLYNGPPAAGDDGSETAGPGADTRVSCAVGGGTGPLPVQVDGLTVQLPPEAGVNATFTLPSPAAATAAGAALSYLGTPYVWGGGGSNGPSQGTYAGASDRAAEAVAAGTNGFDCSGLTQYAYAQAGITLPRVSQQQAAHSRTIPWAQALPGDLLFWGSPVHHVALYLGEANGTHYMVEALRTGTTVHVSPVRTGGDFTNTVVRPSAGLAPKGSG